MQGPGHGVLHLAMQQMKNNINPYDIEITRNKPVELLMLDFRDDNSRYGKAFINCICKEYSTVDEHGEVDYDVDINDECYYHGPNTTYINPDDTLPF